MGYCNVLILKGFLRFIIPPTCLIVIKKIHLLLRTSYCACDSKESPNNLFVVVLRRHDGCMAHLSCTIDFEITRAAFSGFFLIRLAYTEFQLRIGGIYPCEIIQRFAENDSFWLWKFLRKHIKIVIIDFSKERHLLALLLWKKSVKKK